MKPMTVTIEAIFENGVLKPLHPLALAERQKVHLVVETRAEPDADERKPWHWREAQAIRDGFAGEAADELLRLRREG